MDRTRSVPDTEAAAIEAPAALAPAVARDLALPLAALRAAMESLAADLGEDPRTRTVEAALEEVRRLGEAVEEVVDWLVPPEPAPLACTAAEIVCSALRPFPAEDRVRVAVAGGDGVDELYCDAPLVSKCVHRLVVHALACDGGLVLLRPRRARGRTAFVVVHRPGSARVGEGTAALALHLAARDAARMGGTLEVASTSTGGIQTILWLPERGRGTA